MHTDVLVLVGLVCAIRGRGMRIRQSSSTEERCSVKMAVAAVPSCSSLAKLKNSLLTGQVGFPSVSNVLAMFFAFNLARGWPMASSSLGSIPAMSRPICWSTQYQCFQLRLRSPVIVQSQAKVPSLDSKYAEDARTWFNLGIEGGGELDGLKYSEKECFEKALGCNPEDAQAWSCLGALEGGEVDGQRYSQRECDEKAASLDPSDALAWFNLGTHGGGIVNGEKYSEKDCYEQALSFNPEDADTWLNLGNAGGGRVDNQKYSAGQCYEKALSSDPEDALAWLLLGSVAGGEIHGQRFSENMCYKKALSLNPEDAVAWCNLGGAGGGEVDGLMYSVSDCYQQAKDIIAGMQDQELILQHRISSLVAVRPEAFTLHDSSQRQWSFVHAKGLFDDDMIKIVHNCFKLSGVGPLADRKDSLIYNHDAFPIGLALRSHAPALYERICGVMKWVDAEVWKSLETLPKEVVCLAFEYIMYDARNGTQGTISPHVDNNSAVTMIILLSDTEHFEGGINCFSSSGDSTRKPRFLRLRKGDAVVFRGEELMHWITPVTSGLRIVLQVEISNF